jgi:hypothetical protein
MRSRRATEVWQLFVGLVAYPGLCMLVWLALSPGSDFALGVLALAAPGVLAGFVVRRAWLYAVPVVGWGAALLADYLHDPACSACTQDDWTSLTEFRLIFFVAPALLAIAIGRAAACRRRWPGRDSGGATVL